MSQFSIVMICKNEGETIRNALQSVQGITDDIVVYDTGSTDHTLTVAQSFANVHIHEGKWEGFGKTRQEATSLAKHDWILSLDADEALDTLLHNELSNLSLDNPKIVYRMPFKTFLGNKELKWGEWGSDNHIRLFNRQYMHWNDALVHEKLVRPDDMKEVKLKGYVLHRTMKDMAEYSTKMTHYALLNAEKYFQQGRRSTWVKRYFSGPFAFLQYYIFMLGFLDGWEGLVCARMTAFYTSLKYTRLYELQSSPQAD